MGGGGVVNGKGVDKDLFDIHTLLLLLFDDVAVAVSVFFWRWYCWMKQNPLWCINTNTIEYV